MCCKVEVIDPITIPEQRCFSRVGPLFLVKFQWARILEKKNGERKKNAKILAKQNVEKVPNTIGRTIDRENLPNLNWENKVQSDMGKLKSTDSKKKIA